MGQSKFNAIFTNLNFVCFLLDFKLIGFYCKLNTPRGFMIWISKETSFVVKMRRFHLYLIILQWQRLRPWSYCRQTYCQKTVLQCCEVKITRLSNTQGKTNDQPQGCPNYVEKCPMDACGQEVGDAHCRNPTIQKKMAAVHFTTIPCKPNKANRHGEAIFFAKFVPVLLCMLGLCIFISASYVKNYRQMYWSQSFAARWIDLCISPLTFT